MAKRFTDTEKWKDPWFLDLSPKAKLLFTFLCDSCDMAGFYEKNDRMVSFHTGIDLDEINHLYEELKKSVIIRDRWVFVKNFIRHQKNLPLNPDNNCHKTIIYSLKSKSDWFSDVYKELDMPLPRGCQGAAKGLPSPWLAPAKPLARGLGKGKGNTNSNSNLSLEGCGKPFFEVPEDLKTNEKEIVDWMEYKQQKGQTYKPRGLEAFFRQFRKIPLEKRREAVDFSMSNNWSGLFMKRGENGNKNNDNRSIATTGGEQSKFDGLDEIV